MPNHVHLMQIRKLFKLGVLAIIVTQSVSAQKPATVPWLPATYHGLTVGASTKEDVLRQLGKPKTIGKEQDTGIPIMTFSVSDPAPGVLTVYTKNGVLDGMMVSLRKPLSKREIVQLYGMDYMSVRYATDDCLTEGGTAPIYESPDGPIRHIEYRDKGVGVILHDGWGVAIAFVSKPFGPSRSKCRK